MIDEKALATAAETSAGPETLALAAHDRDRVRAALEALSPEFREAVVLRELEGFSYKEIASITGVPMGTVMSRLSRGRDWLKQLLGTRGKEATEQ